MNTQEFLVKLLQTGAFWTALLALKNALLDWLAPGFPKPVSTAFDTLVVVVAGAFTGVVIQQARSARQQAQDR